MRNTRGKAVNFRHEQWDIILYVIGVTAFFCSQGNPFLYRR